MTASTPKSLLDLLKPKASRKELTTTRTADYVTVTNTPIVLQRCLAPSAVDTVGSWSVMEPLICRRGPTYMFGIATSDRSSLRGNVTPHDALAFSKAGLAEGVPWWSPAPG